MATTIYKTTLAFGRQVLKLPPNARILHVGWQDQQLRLWYMFNLSRSDETTNRVLLVTGTGFKDEIPPDAIHLGTVITEDQFVWHVFEFPNAKETRYLSDA